MNEHLANLIWKVCLLGGGLFSFWLITKFVFNLVCVYNENKRRLLDKFEHLKKS